MMSNQAEMTELQTDGARAVLVDTGVEQPRRSRAWRVAGFTALALAGCAAVYVGVQHFRGPPGKHHGDAEFRAWMEKHGKSYESHEEYMLRKDIFFHNKHFIDHHNHHNTNGLLGSSQRSVLMKANQFADLTSDEFSKTHASCFLGGVRDQPHPASAGVFTYSGAELPKEVDWRKEGAVTPVKNQGQCGSCWSFSTTGALEGHWKIRNGTLTSMSEQELIDCSKPYGNHGCEGGLMDSAFLFEEGHSVCSEESYPYLASDQEKCHDKKCDVVVPKGQIKGFKDVESGSKEALMEALTKGPVSIAIEADKKMFQFYNGGILKDSGEKKCGTQLDHGVLAVGYGEEDGVGYWIVKNSWGGAWGEHGFIRLHRSLGEESSEGGMCGILMQPSFPVFMGDDDDDSNNTPTSQAHYGHPPCMDGEIAVRIQGMVGDYCAPKCDGTSCPAAPAGSSAMPQCVIQSPQGDKYCGLICHAKGDCPAGGSCVAAPGAGGIGLCMYDGDDSMSTIEASFMTDVAEPTSIFE